jgi:catechol 2,3-dioxygenase-like lactoylglutathione lyase family enzyme
MATARIEAGPWGTGTLVSVYPGEAVVNGGAAPSGTPVAQATVDDAGALEFEDSDLLEGRRYIAFAEGRGVRFLVSADHLQQPVSVPDRVRLRRLEDAADVDDESGLGENTMGVVIYDAELEEWPPRPDGALSVMWIGPDAPAIGGSGATADVDVWLPTIEDT